MPVRRKGRIQRRLLTLLAAGVALGLTRDPRAYFRIVHTGVDALRNENKYRVDEALNRLRRQGYIRMRVHDGVWYAELTREGVEASRYFLSDFITLPIHKRWDGKWRIISYDVPEADKWKRQVLCTNLKELGMYEMQQSVFVYPYDCRNEVAQIQKELDLGDAVCFIVALEVMGDDDIREHFWL